MKQADILQATLLDIIFENRNKDYGAYSLRSGYDRRMMAALGAGILLIIVFALAARNGNNSQASIATIPKEEIVIRTVKIPVTNIKEPEQKQVAAKHKRVPKTATVKYTAPVIRKDIEVITPMLSVNELDGKKIDEKTTDGKLADNKVVIIEKSESKPAGPSQPEPKASEFIADEKAPEFPGGAAALKQFLSRNLDTPKDLEEGERKVVRIKFQVNKDGSVSSFEIVTSAGNELDSEVVRVCKKMPRWTPAIQNGISVPVTYMLPVTFIGAE